MGFIVSRSAARGAETGCAPGRFEYKCKSSATSLDLMPTLRSFGPSSTVQVGCISPSAFCLHVFATSLLRVIHIPTPWACPTLLIVFAMYVMPAVFSGCYHCMCGNTLTIPHAFSLFLFFPTSTVWPITKPTYTCARVYTWHARACFTVCVNACADTLTAKPRIIGTLVEEIVVFNQILRFPLFRHAIFDRAH